MFYGLLQLYTARPANSFFKWYYIQQLESPIASPTFTAITFLFTDLISILTTKKETNEISPLHSPRSHQNQIPSEFHSSETPASSHKDMLSGSETQNKKTTQSHFSKPERFLTTAKISEKSFKGNEGPIFTKNGMPLQIPRRDSQISLRSQENKCFTLIVFSVLIGLSISESKSIGVFAALITTVFQRAFSDKQGRLCGHIKIISWLENLLGGKKICGIGIYPESTQIKQRLGEVSVNNEYEQISVESNELQNNRMINGKYFSSPQKKIKKHFGNEDTVDTQDIKGSVSLHIDRNALYER